MIFYKGAESSRVRDVKLFCHWFSSGSGLPGILRADKLVGEAKKINSILTLLYRDEVKTTKSVKMKKKKNHQRYNNIYANIRLIPKTFNPCVKFRRPRDMGRGVDTNVQRPCLKVESTCKYLPYDLSNCHTQFPPLYAYSSMTSSTFLASKIYSSQKKKNPSILFGQHQTNKQTNNHHTKIKQRRKLSASNTAR